MSRRNLWADDETREMLSVMEQLNAIDYLKTKASKVEIYKKIQEQMTIRGFCQKDHKQIENRWKNLKKQYVNVKNRDAIINDETEGFPYFGDIDRLMAMGNISTSSSQLSHESFDCSIAENPSSTLIKFEACDINANDEAIPNVSRTINPNKSNTTLTLGSFVDLELDGVSDEVYQETKWKIFRVLEEASTKERQIRQMKIKRP